MQNYPKPHMHRGAIQSFSLSPGPEMGFPKANTAAAKGQTLSCLLGMDKKSEEATGFEAISLTEVCKYVILDNMKKCNIYL